MPTPVPTPVPDYVPTPVPKPVPAPGSEPDKEPVVKSLSLSNLKKLQQTGDLPPAMKMTDRVVNAIVKNRSAERDIVREAREEKSSNDDKGKKY